MFVDHMLFDHHAILVFRLSIILPFADTWFFESEELIVIIYNDVFTRLEEKIISLCILAAGIAIVIGFSHHEVELVSIVFLSVHLIDITINVCERGGIYCANFALFVIGIDGFFEF